MKRATCELEGGVGLVSRTKTMAASRNPRGESPLPVEVASRHAHDAGQLRARAQTEILDRKRLTAELVGARKPFVLLAAPPGFGKTTLLHQWADADDRSFAWVSLDAASNDPVLFWSRIIETLGAVESSIEGASRLALRAPHPDIVAGVVPLLAHDLARGKRDVVLVLDDYHVIENDACHSSLSLFLAWLPFNVTVALATRVDPSLAVASLRARGELFELRAADLAFTAREEATFLNDRLRLGLPAALVGDLRRRTEGWPAGVYLAALSLKKTDDKAGFVAAFSGSNRHVVDYLTEVVLDTLDAETREFLVEVSILDSVCGPLADAVTGREGSAEILEELERANLFLVGLDDDRDWYRFHQLFCELLRGQLARRGDERMQELHRRAFAWYAEAGHTAAAVHHGIVAGEVEAAAELAGRQWVPRLDCDASRATIGWLRSFPLDAIASNPILLLAKAWAAGTTNGADEAARALDRVEQLCAESGEDAGLAARRAIVEACIPHGDAGGMLAAAELATELVDELPAEWRPLAPLALGWAGLVNGDYSGATASLEDAAAASRELEQWLHVSIAHSLLARCAVLSGETARAGAATSRANDVLEAHRLVDSLATGLAEIAQGSVLSHGDHEAAERALDRGLAYLRAYGEPLVVVDGLLALAPVKRNIHGVSAGRECIAAARELLDGCPDGGNLVPRLTELARSLTPSYKRVEGDSELTERELEVLRYLAEGMPKRDIGATLFLSYNTIHSHTKSIYQKLRVSSRQAAVDAARELGAL